MLWRTRKRKVNDALKKIEMHINFVCQIRAVNTPPFAGAKRQTRYLQTIVQQIELAMQNNHAIRTTLFGIASAQEMAYLRHALNQMEIYHETAGVQAIGNDNAQMYIIFIKSKLMALCREAVYHVNWV